MPDVEKIRSKLRIKNTSLDEEIQDNIDTCLLDLERVGVDCCSDNSMLDKACELYCKWQMNFLGQGEKFENNYNSLRDSLSLSSDYKMQDTE